jgi:hypothetical protein
MKYGLEGSTLLQTIPCRVGPLYRQERYWMESGSPVKMRDAVQHVQIGASMAVRNADS